MNQNLVQKPNYNWLKALFVAAILTCLIFICSCNCNYHLSKAEKKCGSHLIKDTIRITDTLITKEVSVDTVFNINSVHDTLILRKENVIYKYFYNRKDSTIYLDGKSLSDTIIRIIKMPCDKLVLETNWFDKFKWFIYIGGILVFAYYVIKLFKK